MKLGSYQFVITEKHRKGIVDITPEKTRELEQKVDELPEILGGSNNWALSGGLAIVLSIGRFYRVNSDVDILINSQNLWEIVNRAQTRGYELFFRLADIKIGSRKNLYIYKAATEEIAKKNGYRHLKLMRINKQGKAKDSEDILDSIELFSYKRVDDTTILTEKGFLFPGNKMFQSGTTISGKPITISSLDYLIRIKELFIEKKRHNPREKDVLDIQILKDFIAAEMGQSQFQTQETPR
jgi:hypothetical protein